jgi:hypothetical protein
MPPNKPQFNYSKRPIRKIRLLKIGPPRSKGLFEEYFYWIVAGISAVVAILGKAGGLSGYNAAVTGLWVGAFLWFARQFKSYRKVKESAGRLEKSRQALQAPSQVIPQVPSGNMKPMIGPQWPLKTAPGMRPGAPVQTAQKNTSEQTPPEKRRGFVYERPTLPDRKPKFPANWADKPDKKPKP